MGQPERLVEQLFSNAVDMLPEHRALYLEAVCKEDPVLRRVVESLLLENDRLSGFLSTPAYAGDGSPGETTAPPQSFLPAGSHLGRYTILETLGMGGMGVVYRALDEKLEREVAIKMLAAGVLRNEAARKHFRLEALALAKLNHPNIAAVYDAGEQDGQDYIVMELVQGESLTALLRAKNSNGDFSGLVDVRMASQIVLEVLDALKEAHARKIAHRDLKPGNLMMTPKGHVKVLDFGLAKMLEGDAAITQMQGIAGTPMYMSPEQALGDAVDARTDLWSLGVIYYEALTGQPPFRGESNISVLRAVTQAPLTQAKKIRPSLPPLADAIVTRALEKDRKNRYQTAEEMERDVALLVKPEPVPRPWWQQPKWMLAGFAAILTVVCASGWVVWRHIAEQRWVNEVALPKIESEFAAKHPLEAMTLLSRAQKDLPGDARLKQLEDTNTLVSSIHSEPAGATVEIQDYLLPQGAWKTLGTTPIANVRIPRVSSPIRWRITKQGVGQMIVAPPADAKMDFPLDKQVAAPAGMVYVPSQQFGGYIFFLGYAGSYVIPPHYVDRYEVTNREYQQFVDAGGYGKAQYWTAQIVKDGHPVPWSQAVADFTDTTGRPGPSMWIGGHFPEGQADYPVSGVSWYEAMAYAAWAGKSLPVLGQFYVEAPLDFPFTVPLSNFGGTAPAPVGKFQGVGPWGTYDMAGNVREWIANTTDNNLRFALGGAWDSPQYFYSNPEAFAPTDRRLGNGFRTVKNISPLPQAASQTIHRELRDFTKVKPANDEVYRAYKATIYDYDKTPLNAKDYSVVRETNDWREEKVVVDAAYNGERFAIYLFLPRRARPPYQTVLFLPSARVYSMAPDSSTLGDTQFFDYVVQSGRAVVYPVYQSLYERHKDYSLNETTMIAAWYKDAGRTLDYLETRKDIDSSRLAFLGVSMGASDGATVSTLLQDRLKTAVWLDGGYFLVTPQTGSDQADFIPRMKKPVLMVNGRYDYVFPLNESQNPMFNMLGTPAADKSHIVLNTPHDVTENRPVLVRNVLEWLDKYLGKVSE